MLFILRAGLLTSVFYLLGCVITALIALFFLQGRLIVLSRWPYYVYFATLWFVSYTISLRLVTKSALRWFGRPMNSRLALGTTYYALGTLSLN